MTKLRPPVSIENTLDLVMAQLSMERATFVTRRKPDYLRALSDPDRRELLTFRDAQALDEDYFVRVARRHPIRETYGLILDANRPSVLTAPCDFASHAVTVARESGEATAALVQAALDGKAVHLCAEAVRQLEDNHAATGAAIGALREHIRRARDGPPGSG